MGKHFVLSEVAGQERGYAVEVEGVEESCKSATLAGEVLAVPSEEEWVLNGDYHELPGQEITANAVSSLCAHCAGVLGEISVNASSVPCGITTKDCATEKRKTERMKRLIASLLSVS